MMQNLYLQFKLGCFPLAFFLFFCTNAVAQIYVETVGGVLPLNICNCVLGAPVITTGSAAIAVAPNQNLYLLENNQLVSYNLNTGTNTVVASVPNSGNGMVTATNGIVYVIGVNPSGTDASLTSINPNTGVVTNLGNLPVGMIPGGDLFFYNGNLYGTVEYNGENNIALIPINNPGAATILFNSPNWGGILGAASLFVNGVETVYISTFDGNSGVEGIFQVDMVTGAITLVCPVTQVFDLATLTGSSISSCCTNFAGTFTQTTLVTACQNQAVDLTHNGNEVLSAGSVLSFILVTNPNATLPTGVLQISTSPDFSFDPATMSFSTTYYVAAVAAPANNGVPVWNAPCFNLSAFVPVQWKPLPAVSLSVPNPSLCSGACRTITASLSGTPPFNLSYSTPAGSFSQIFAGNTGTFQVCAPTGAPAGPFQVQALSLSDGFCTCN